MSINFNTPIESQTVAARNTSARDAQIALARWLEGVAVTGAVAGIKRLNNGVVEEWSGTAWVEKPLALSASHLNRGTIPDARFPATLPALSGVNLTALNASNLGSGNVPSARVTGAYPGITGVGQLPGLDLSGHRPRIRGDITTFQPLAANADGRVAVAPTGTFTEAILELFSSPDLGNASRAFLSIGNDALALVSTRNGTGVTRPIQLRIEGGTALEIGTGRNVTIFAPISGNTLTVVGSVSASGVVHGGGGAGAAFRVGDDLEIWDVNLANTAELRGVSDPTAAGLKFGSTGPTLSRTGAGLTSSGPLVVGARAHTPTVTVAFSATPTFDAHLSNYFEFGTMTANVTGSTVINPVGGHSFSIRCVQDATGGRTFALPAGASVTGSIDTRANAVSYLQLTYSTAAARWEGTWIRITP